MKKKLIPGVTDQSFCLEDWLVKNKGYVKGPHGVLIKRGSKPPKVTVEKTSYGTKTTVEI